MLPCICYCPWYCHSKRKLKFCILWRGGGPRGHVCPFFREVFYTLEGFSYPPLLWAEPGWLIPELLILWREHVSYLVAAQQPDSQKVSVICSLMPRSFGMGSTEKEGAEKNIKKTEDLLAVILKKSKKGTSLQNVQRIGDKWYWKVYFSFR